VLTSQAIEPKFQTLQAAPREEISASVVRNARRDTASASERTSQCSNYTEVCSVLKCFGMTGQPLAAKSLAVSACGHVMRITLQPDGHNITCSNGGQVEVVAFLMLPMFYYQQLHSVSGV